MLKKILVIPLIILLVGCNPDDKDKSSDFVVPLVRQFIIKIVQAVTVLMVKALLKIGG